MWYSGFFSFWILFLTATLTNSLPWDLDPTFQVKNLKLVKSDNTRLWPRGEQEGEIVTFETNGKKYAIKLIPSPYNAREILWKEHNDTLLNTSKLTAKSFTADKMVVSKLDVSEDQLLAALAGSKEDSLIEGEIIEEAQGKFQIIKENDNNGQEKCRIIGGFIHGNQFLKTQIDGKLTYLSPISLEEGNSSKLNNQTSTRSGDECGHDQLHFNLHQQKGAIAEMSLFHRKKRGKNVRSLSRCDGTKKVLYLGVVADCEYMKAFNFDGQAAMANILNDFQIVSSIYEETFGISFGILSVETMMRCESKDSDHFNVPCDQSIDISERLQRFSKWRGSQPSEAGLYHLVTGCPSQLVAGISWLHQVCQTESRRTDNGEWVSGTGVTVLVKNQFAAIAHEIGHNFGAIHDCTADVCQECTNGIDKVCDCCPCGKECDCHRQYIMDPTSGGVFTKVFSPCSISTICKKLPLYGTCLKSEGAYPIVNRATCGNGIREKGEDCDCGGEEKCKDDPCCNIDCTFKSGAICSDTNDICCENCHLIPAKEKHICNPSKGLCEMPSYCDGINRACPKPMSLIDGTNCGKDTKCATGECTSRKSQCLTLGEELGITGECGFAFDSCQLTCAIGTTPRSCTEFQGKTFLDGTPCGYHGRCYSGECQDDSWKFFIWKNAISILMAIVVLFFAILLGTSFRKSSTTPQSSS